MTTRYTTLVIAPKTDLLLVDDEVQQVNNLLGAKLLQGSQATIHGLLAILASPFDIVWFATHGSAEGIYLTPENEKANGILNASEITALVRSCGARLVVFNTCSSRSVALTIYDELRIPMVCTLKPVPDRMAFITGTIFARKVADGYSFKDSYELAKPGQNSTYLFLPESETQREMPPLNDNEKFISDLTSLAALVRRLQILVSGDTDYNVKGLIPTVKDLDSKVDILIEDFAVVKANQLFNKRLLFTMTILCVVLLIGMAILVSRVNLL